jgi:hypothetical protein
MMNKHFDHYSKLKLNVESHDMWNDIVSQYKNPSMNLKCQLSIKLDNQPPIDTGEVRRQVCSRVLEDFATNKFIELFDGPTNHLRPACNAEARSSGLFHVLGTLVGHCLCQDGIGFPYLSPTSYWYLSCGEVKALEFASIQDLPADAATFVSQVKHDF